MFNQGEKNKGFDLINHAIRMGIGRDVLEMRNAELLRHLNGANVAFLARSAELQAQQSPAAMMSPSPSPSKPVTVRQQNSAQKQANSNSFQFPWKLHDMLDESAAAGLDDIVSWTDDGRSFRVHRPQKFVESVMCRYFKQTKYKSFQRQLNLYGFNRLNGGHNKGGYQHKFFIRGQRNLCQMISRNNSGDGAPAGFDEGSRPQRTSTCAAVAVERSSPPAPAGEHEREPKRDSLAPLAEAAISLLTTTTPKTIEPEESSSSSLIPPTTATISVGSTSNNSAVESGCSENSDEETTTTEDPYKSLMQKEFQFPWKLHEMLERSELDSFEHIVCWLPGDACFKVHEQSLFVKNILPRFFKQTKYKSFQRQLNLYGFIRVDDGPNKGAYRHNFFLKGRKELLNKVARQKMKNTGDDHSSTCEDTDNESRKSDMQNSGIPAILAAIECAEAAATSENSKVDPIPSIQLSWRQDPIESLSDWTIEVVARETKATTTYHVHRRILAFGPKRSEYFAQLFENPRSTKKSVFELGSAEAQVFPTLLDHMYTNSELHLDMIAAYALYSIADQLEVHSLLLCVTDFFSRITSKDNVVDFLKIGESFRDKMLLYTIFDRCAEELRSIDLDTARKIKPTLLVEVLRRSKIVSKKHKCSSSRLSQVVAACMEEHRSSLSLELFRTLTDKEYLPYIEGTAAIKVLALEQEFTSQGSEPTLHERCLSSITNSWDNVKQKLEEDPMLAGRMKAVSSAVLYEILMRTTRYKPLASY